MSRSMAERLARAASPPEDSVAIRGVVAAMVELSIVAVVVQGAVDAATAVGALALAPAGYAFSYARRRRPSALTKVALAVGLLVALGAFLRAVQGARSFDDARQPLASMFLWVQVLHAFDVPRRRDLGFSVVSSLVLMAEAGALSFGTGFLALLVPWLAIAGTYLYLTLGPEETPRVVSVRRLPPVGRSAARRRTAVGRTVAVWVVVTAALATAAFVSMPRLPGLNMAAPPFRAEDARVVPGFEGQVVNPALAVGPGGVPAFSELAYPGFSSSVDLRARGRLSDRVVLQVRSPQAALWRGLAYDTYDGTRWTVSDDAVTAIGRGFDSFETGVEGAAWGESQRVLATFYVHADLPNVVFGAYRPTTVYFPASTLAVDAYGSIRSPILLEGGVVYSVVSDVPTTSPDVLRTMDTIPGDPELDAATARYLQLPAALPERVARLAERITAGAPTRFDAVVAVESWIRRTTVYDLDIPPDPPGVDAVDHFLFGSRRGYCEQIASAMAVLLRAAGVPTRLVTGFGPGDRNPFTGYWDVRASDAHAWVEVLYPGAGWIAYDPTFGVPPADPGLAGRFVAPEVLRAVGRFLSDAVPAPVRDAARAVGRAVATAAGAWPLAVAGVAALAATAVVVRRRRDGRERRPPPRGASRAFVDLERAMAARGHARPDHETAREFLRRVRPVLRPDERADAELVVELFERDRFSAAAVGDDDVGRALAASGRLAAGQRSKAYSAESHTRR